MGIKVKRQIVKIDAEKCNGCGLCVNACAEGAIQIVDGKAKVVSDSYCDGLGACLGECPQGAIAIEERLADTFDEAAAKAQAHVHTAPPAAFQPAPVHHEGKMPCGCPSTMSKAIERPAKPSCGGQTVEQSSELTHWPVQLALVSPQAPYWKGADILLCADCVPFAHGNFHADLLKGRKVVVACPKLDDIDPQLEKFASLLANNAVKSLTAARMEVPCCGGIVKFAQDAVRKAGINLPVNVVIVGIDGTPHK